MVVAAAPAGRSPPHPHRVSVLFLLFFVYGVPALILCLHPTICW